MSDIQAFFDRYARALSEIDLDALAELYDYPALAVTRQASLAVVDPDQTRRFFAANGRRYKDQGVDAVRIVDPRPGYDERGLWVGLAVLENLDAAGAVVGVEHNAYVLVDRGAGWRIAVTSPLDAG